MPRPHFFATESRTMCGSPVGERSTGVDTFVEFVALYQHAPGSVCPHCLHCARRFMHYRGPLRTAMQVYCRTNGIDPADLPRELQAY